MNAPLNAALLLFTLGFIHQVRAESPAKPHILYIVADDLGWKDVGFHGCSDIKTPNIDHLAANGTRLEQFYTLPFCTPSRAAVMTGRYPFRYGLQSIVIPSKGTYGLDTTERTLPDLLKSAGYRTEMIGKWHLGHADRKYWPRQSGFDYHYGAVLGEIDYFTHSAHDVLDWQRDNHPVKEEGYATQLLGTDAVRRLQGHDPATPLFMYLAFTAPHTPYQAPEDYIKRHAHIPDETRRTYAGMVSCLDDEIGRVLAALEAKGMRQNTLIVFHSDNGGTRDARMTGEGNVKTVPCDNGPLNGGKGQLYEGGTRVPAFVTWPGHIPGGSELRDLVHVVDMLPTLVHLAGGSTAACKPLDGSNILPSLTEGRPTGRDEIVYNLEPYRAALRQGPWKLIWSSLLPARIELFNLKTDPNEKQNLAADQPEKVKALQASIEQLAKEAAKPLFFQAAAEAIFSGIFGPAPIPMDEETITTEP